MLSHILSLSQRLISIPSTQDNPQALHQVLAIAKQQLTSFTIEEFTHNNIPSLLAYSSPSRPKKFKILLNAHLDVVPGKTSQFTPRLHHHRLYGRGAYDMKAAAAVFIHVFQKLAPQLSYPLGLQLVTDEETGGFSGTKHQIEHKVLADFVITGEPTNLALGYRAKGILWLKITTAGQSAHGAYPWQGDNALLKAVTIINRLYQLYPLPSQESWQTTINLARLTTPNTTFNTVPDQAEISLDIRYIPKDKDHLLTTIRQAINNLGKLHIILNEPCQATPPTSPYLTALSQAIKSFHSPQLISRHGASDLRHFPSSTHGVEFGPQGNGHHTDSEWVDIPSLATYTHILTNFLTSL